MSGINLVGMAQSILTAPQNHAELDDFVARNGTGMPKEREEQYEQTLRD